MRPHLSPPQRRPLASSEARANRISFLRRFGQVRLTRPLRPAPPRFPLDVHPLARLHADGRLELVQAAFPPLGRARLVLWHPGREPAFTLIVGAIGPGWRFDGPRVEGWVVLWSAEGDTTEPF